MCVYLCVRPVYVIQSDASLNSQFSRHNGLNRFYGIRVEYWFWCFCIANDIKIYHPVHSVGIQNVYSICVSEFVCVSNLCVLEYQAVSLVIVFIPFIHSGISDSVTDSIGKIEKVRVPKTCSRKKNCLIKEWTNHICCKQIFRVRSSKTSSKTIENYSKKHFQFWGKKWLNLPPAA